MTKDAIPLAIDDVSRFAKALRATLALETGHQTILNAVAKAAGFRNFQHLSAETVPVPPPDRKLADRAAGWFDAEGRFTGWPAKTKLQMLCLWAIWARVPPRTEMTERQLSTLIDGHTTFRDAAQVRRGMVEAGLVERNPDGSVYRRVERAPGPTERLLIARVVK